MDRPTLDAYAAHAVEFVRRHAAAGNGVAEHFPLAFPAGSHVLDVGSGSGRDLAALVAAGHEARGVEPVAAMRAEAARLHPELDGRMVEGALPDGLPSAEALGGPFDGILCSAVLMHLDRSELFDATFRLRGLLRPGGRALVSVPIERRDVGEDGRDPLGRLFNGVAAGELELLFQRVGFRTISRSENDDTLGRKAVRWAVFVFERAHDADAASPRPLDRIEAVLRQDKKVASYKLALMRALTDVATSRPRVVRWRHDRRVAVPIGDVADLWIEYYWPLFASGTFLPQMNGEAEAGEHKLGFARPLETLVERFARTGGLAGFLSDLRGGVLAPDAEHTVKDLRAKLRNAIRSGPVHYAGRSTSGALFGYERGWILVDEDLWQEIALMSHWVRDSLLVRWAELTARLAGSGGEPKEPVLRRALGVLLTPAFPERETLQARKVYASLPEPRCVWTGRTLGAGFDVDHVIPFALWHNNDLWNLLPASPAVNKQKRDRLPTRKLLAERRSAIVDCWQALHEGIPRRFEIELSHLTGRESLDIDAGFESLCEAVEVTAIQRSCERWSP